MTMPSPWIIGITLTRTSTSRPLTRNLMRPSWGSRFSAMFRWAIIFNRLMIAAAKRLISGGVGWSCRMPSMRNRIDSPFSLDSMWTSLVLDVTASIKISLTNRTTEASWASSPNSLPSVSICSSNSTPSASRAAAISPSIVSLPTPR